MREFTAPLSRYLRLIECLTFGESWGNLSEAVCSFSEVELQSLKVKRSLCILDTLELCVRDMSLNLNNVICIPCINL